MRAPVESENLRACPSYPGYYADEKGGVFSDKARNGRNKNGQLRQLKPVLNVCRGYWACSLRIGGVTKTVTVHHLVLDAFVGPRPHGMECRHLDGNKENNRLENLRWGTRSENERDKIAHGTDHRGEKHHAANLTWQQVEQIRREYRRHTPGFMQKDLAKKLGVSRRTVEKVLNNRTWQRR